MMLQHQPQLSPPITTKAVLYLCGACAHCHIDPFRCLYPILKDFLTWVLTWRWEWLTGSTDLACASHWKAGWIWRVGEVWGGGEFTFPSQHRVTSLSLWLDCSSFMKMRSDNTVHQLLDLLDHQSACLDSGHLSLIYKTWSDFYNTTVSVHHHVRIKLLPVNRYTSHPSSTPPTHHTDHPLIQTIHTHLARLALHPLPLPFLPTLSLSARSPLIGSSC